MSGRLRNGNIAHQAHSHVPQQWQAYQGQQPQIQCLTLPGSNLLYYPSTALAPTTVPTALAPLTLEQQQPLSKASYQHYKTVTTINLDCRLDLKTTALHTRNVEYNPKHFAAVRIRDPKMTVLTFASGKMTGAKLEDDSQLASHKYAKIVQKLGSDAKLLGVQHSKHHGELRVWHIAVGSLVATNLRFSLVLCTTSSSPRSYSSYSCHR